MCCYKREVENNCPKTLTENEVDAIEEKLATLKQELEGKIDAVEGKVDALKHLLEQFIAKTGKRSK